MLFEIQFFSIQQTGKRGFLKVGNISTPRFNNKYFEFKLKISLFENEYFWDGKLLGSICKANTEKNLSQPFNSLTYIFVCMLHKNK